MATLRGNPWVLSAFASTLLLSSAAYAQPQQPTAPTGDAALVEARRLYDEGRGHFDAGRFTEALASFERAYLMRSNPVVLVPIIECQERLNRVVDAIASIERYLRERPTAPDRASMEQRLQSLRARPTRVNVTSDPPGARVVLDGRELPHTTPAEVQLPPGRHRIAVSRDGQTGPEREIDALPGGALDLALSTAAVTTAPVTTPPVTTAPVTTPPVTTPPVTTPPVVAAPETPAVTTPPVTTPPVTTPPVTTRRGPSPAVWVAASAAGVGLVMGTVFGLMALSDASSYDQTPTQDLYDRGRMNALVSDIGFGVAVLSAAVGVIVYFADRDSSRERRPAAAAAPPTRWTMSPGGLVVNF